LYEAGIKRGRSGRLRFVATRYADVVTDDDSEPASTTLSRPQALHDDMDAALAADRAVVKYLPSRAVAAAVASILQQALSPPGHTLTASSTTACLLRWG